jgi:hypothetical protein
MGVGKGRDKEVEEGLEKRNFNSYETIPGSDAAGSQEKVPSPRNFFEEMLIDPPEGKSPEPRPSVAWLDSLSAGWQEAIKENRPLFVLVHCPEATRPAKPVELFLSPPPGLADLLRQYVTVELTDAQQIDLVRMPFEVYQDPDQTWWCWILSPQGGVYSVLGQQHPDRDKVFEEDVRDWLSSVLDHHWDPRRPDWKADGEEIPGSVPSVSILDNPGYAKWRQGAEYLGNLRAEGHCMCCHQVQDVFWCEDDLAHEFRSVDDYWIWPPPEKVGLSFDREASSKLAAVEPGSLGEKLDFQASDRIGTIIGRRVFSATDVRAMIQEFVHPHATWSDIDQDVHLVRHGEIQKKNLLTQGVLWANYDVLWRTSIKESVLASHPGFLVQQADDDTRRKLNLIGRMAFFPQLGQQSPAWQTGLRPGQLIVSCGPRTERFTPEEFYFFYKMNLPVGARADLSIRYGEGWKSVRKLQIPAISVLDLPPEAIQMIKQMEQQEQSFRP